MPAYVRKKRAQANAEFKTQTTHRLFANLPSNPETACDSNSGTRKYAERAKTIEITRG
jgi:hypothetical protein